MGRRVLLLAKNHKRRHHHQPQRHQQRRQRRQPPRTARASKIALPLRTKLAHRRPDLFRPSQPHHRSHQRRERGPRARHWRVPLLARHAPAGRSHRHAGSDKWWRPKFQHQQRWHEQRRMKLQFRNAITNATIDVIDPSVVVLNLPRNKLFDVDGVEESLDPQCSPNAPMHGIRHAVRSVLRIPSKMDQMTSRRWKRHVCTTRMHGGGPSST